MVKLRRQSEIKLHFGSIPVRIKLKKALSEPVNIVFKENKELRQNYNGEQLGNKDFPQGTFADAKITVPAGNMLVEGLIVRNGPLFHLNVPPPVQRCKRSCRAKA